MEDKIRLTQYSKGAGCGCKIAPQVLEEILKHDNLSPIFEELLMGNETKDDAAIYQLNDEEALIASTDFFTPIVDDPFLFGQIAAANAISDIYAMGGNPMLALAILGWPIDKLPTSAAKKVLDGAREMCQKAKIPLAGGHSIDSNEPIFGLSVNGRVLVKNVKYNDKAEVNDVLLLTKPIGIGVLSTAMKRGVIEPEDDKILTELLTQLNSIGAQLGQLPDVHAMTDITGFGIAGHLIEMAEGAKISVELNYDKLPKINNLQKYLSKNVIPDATYRNWNSFEKKIKIEKSVNAMESFQLLPDPQTNGGLLICVAENGLETAQQLLRENGYANFVQPIGKIVEKQDFALLVK